MPDESAGPERLERCPVDGVPLVLVTYGGALGGTGVVMLGCPLCNKVVAYQETAPPSEVLESGTRWPRPTRRRRGRSKPGHSAHGIRLIDVQRAFAEAEKVLGTKWQLKGRGHCRRASLDARYSKYAVSGAKHSWALVRTPKSRWPRRLFALAIVTKAAEILDVPAHLFICREW